MFRVIIAGCRDFKDYDLLKEKVCTILQNVPGEIEIVSGTCRGTDQMGERLAHEKGWAVKQFPADWQAHGKMGGPIRNKEMAVYADALVVFLSEKSRGSRNMLQLAKEFKLQIRVINI
jgi:hypothetical protein